MSVVIESPVDIIARYSQEAPVNLAGIANDLGINLLQADLGSQVSGAIKKNSDRDNYLYTIFVNKNDNPNRQRFTIAHELAHFLLHKEFIGDGIQEDPLYRSGLSNLMERQANRLAAHILMPPNLISRLAQECRNDIMNMARNLEVSETALRIRLGR